MVTANGGVSVSTTKEATHGEGKLSVQTRRCLFVLSTAMLLEIVNTLTDQGREVGLSSLRPNRLKDEFVGALARAGYRTLTTAIARELSRAEQRTSSFAACRSAGARPPRTGPGR